MCSWVIQPEEASSEILLHVRIFHRSTTNAEPILATGTLPEFAGLDPPLSCPYATGKGERGPEVGATSTTTEELNGGGSPPLCAATRELVNRACLDRRRFIPCQHEQATAGSTGLETRRGAKLGGGVGLSRRGDLAKPRSMLAAKTLLDPLRRELEVGSAAATKLNVHMLPCPVVRARRERRRWGPEKGEASAATGKRRQRGRGRHGGGEGDGRE